MKRIKAACIQQTLLFSQKEELGLTKEQALAANREEFERYQRNLKKTSTRYQIVKSEEQADGSILVHVRKQYNHKADVDEYFD